MGEEEKNPPPDVYTITDMSNGQLVLLEALAITLSGFLNGLKIIGLNKLKP